MCESLYCSPANPAFAVHRRAIITCQEREKVDICRSKHGKKTIWIWGPDTHRLPTPKSKCTNLFFSLFCWRWTLFSPFRYRKTRTVDGHNKQLKTAIVTLSSIKLIEWIPTAEKKNFCLWAISLSWFITVYRWRFFLSVIVMFSVMCCFCWSNDILAFGLPIKNQPPS